MNITQRVLTASKRMAVAIEGMTTHEAMTAIAVLTGSVLFSARQESASANRAALEGHIEQVKMAIAANMRHELQNPSKPSLILPAR